MAPAARAGEPLGGSETRLKRLACCLYDVLWPGERVGGGAGAAGVGVGNGEMSDGTLTPQA